MKQTAIPFSQRLVENQLELRCYIRSLMPGCSGDVEDIAQNTNLALVQHEAEYDPARPFRPWLFAFARKQVMAHRLLSARSPLVYDDDLANRIGETMIDESPDEEASGTASLLRRLEACKKRLPEHHRLLIDARYLSGRSVTDLARERRITPHAVTVTLSYIRKKLGDCIRSLCRLPEDGSGTLTTEEEELASYLEEGGGKDADHFRSLLRSPDALRFWIGQNRLDELLRLEASDHVEAEPESAPVRRRVFAVPLRAAAALAVFLAIIALGYQFVRLAAKPSPAGAIAVGTSSTAAGTSVPSAVWETSASASSVPTPASAALVAAVSSSESLPAASVPMSETASNSTGFTQQGGTQMKVTTAVAAATVAAALGAAPSGVALANIRAGNESAPVGLCIHPEATLFWRTSPGPVIPLRWVWPRDATEATLTIGGLNRSLPSQTFVRQAGEAEGNYDFSGLAPKDTLTEDAFELTLAFNNGELYNARLGSVRGVNGDSSCLIVSPAAKEWGQTDRTAVIPIPQGTTAFTAYSAKGTLTVEWDGGIGWYGWGPVEVGKYKLSVDGITWPLADVERVPGGTSVTLY